MLVPRGKLDLVKHFWLCSSITYINDTLSWDHSFALLHIFCDYLRLLLLGHVGLGRDIRLLVYLHLIWFILFSVDI